MRSFPYYQFCFGICAYVLMGTRARVHTEVRAQPRVLSLRNHLPCVWRHETLSLAGIWRALIQLDGRPVNPKDLPGLPSTALTTEPTPPPAPLVHVLSIGRSTVLPRCFLRVGFWWKRRSSRLTCQKRIAGIHIRGFLWGSLLLRFLGQFSKRKQFRDLLLFSVAVRLAGSRHGFHCSFPV